MKLRALTAIALAACGATPPPRAPSPGSRGLRADQHLDAAREHERRAQELARWPETRTGGAGAFDDPRGGLWYRRWDTSEDEARLAASHHSAAAELQARYEEACGETPADRVSVSPLQRHGVGGTNQPDGVLIFLRPDAGRPDALLEEIRCHRAWMMLGEAGMEDCPLDLAGIRVVAHGDPNGISVEITVSDPRLVPELQRRAARDLESAAARRRETEPRAPR
jgi:hypothetical protein